MYIIKIYMILLSAASFHFRFCPGGERRCKLTPVTSCLNFIFDETIFLKMDFFLRTN